MDIPTSSGYHLFLCHFHLSPDYLPLDLKQKHNILSLGFVFHRLEETKASVRKALADDFDTPRAIGAIMNLVYHGNRHLQPITKVPSNGNVCSF